MTYISAKTFSTVYCYLKMKYARLIEDESNEALRNHLCCLFVFFALCIIWSRGFKALYYWAHKYHFELPKQHFCWPIAGF